MAEACSEGSHDDDDDDDEEDEEEVVEEYDDRGDLNDVALPLSRGVLGGGPTGPTLQRGAAGEGARPAATTRRRRRTRSTRPRPTRRSWTPSC